MTGITFGIRFIMKAPENGDFGMKKVRDHIPVKKKRQSIFHHSQNMIKNSGKPLGIQRWIYRLKGYVVSANLTVLLLLIVQIVKKQLVIPAENGVLHATPTQKLYM